MQMLMVEIPGLIARRGAWRCCVFIGDGPQESNLFLVRGFRARPPRGPRNHYKRSILTVSSILLRNTYITLVTD